MCRAGGEVEEAEDDIGDWGYERLVEGADDLAEGEGEGMEDGVVGGEGEEEAEAYGEGDVPQLEEPGGGDFAVDDKTDEPGEDQGAEFVKVAGVARHGLIGGGAEDKED